MLPGVLLLVSTSVAAQTNDSSVMLRATVSETVSLSVLPNLTQSDIRIDGLSSGNTVRMTLSGTDAGSAVVRVPLLVRSNSGFKITAVLDSKSTVVTRVVITSVQPTGTLVSRQAVRDIKFASGFDARGLEERIFPDSVGLELSEPLLVLSGPRISLGGTLNSPGNALEIVLLIHLKSDFGPVTSARLTLLATPESQIP